MSPSYGRTAALDGCIDTHRADSQYELVSTVLRLATLARTQFGDALKPAGMSWARYEVLALLCRNGPSSYREIGAELARHRTSIKSTVAALEESGHVTRSSDWKWPQRLLVEATESGRRAVTRAEKALHRNAIPQEAADEYPTALEALRRLERTWTQPRLLQ
ncbi:MarR family winged helix-turn-helix transcriptional regulator [Rhodococcoides kyotonense]|uniref:HTH marR-type domain-containing protein n=1 Tax=Rhodococcoides kyotonense TaxID=398843 RepID=A0A177YMU2_9NOCA|nr:MarR family transcriptional regulator [Rhodococcus kyotonensis]OAK56877.1 hypothetical protein A3K89_14745 [Rhodococcus kyotonensis]